MKQITALFLTLWLLGALPVSARAEELPPCALTVLREAEETAPEETVPPEPFPTPTPSPPPDALDALLGQNPIDYEVDLAAYYLEEMTAAAEAGDDQISFADIGADEVRRALLEIDLNTLTPIEGMNLLFELQRKARA